MVGDNGFENDPENKGLTLTTEVLCIAIMTQRGGTEKKKRDKGREDDTTVHFS